MTLDAKTLKTIKVIESGELEDKYRIKGHPIGVIITSSEN
jgi:hypothetical protein